MSADLYVKFAAVLADVETIRKNQEADAGKYVIRYADINQVLHMLKPILAAHGLAMCQPITVMDGNVMVTTTLICVESGDTLDFPGPAFPVKGDPQAAGGCITYFRRYGLVSLFALESEDDDAQAAHVQAVDPLNRTPAETEVRAIITALPQEHQSRFIAQFRELFGSTLTDLPTGRHGDALTFAKSWVFTPAVVEQPELPAE